jgi:hypothetical protein
MVWFISQWLIGSVIVLLIYLSIHIFNYQYNKEYRYQFASNEEFPGCNMQTSTYISLMMTLLTAGLSCVALFILIKNLFIILVAIAFIILFFCLLVFLYEDLH